MEQSANIRRAMALADYSPDGLMPEHEHHVVRRGMGGRSAASEKLLPTIGVSARLHHRIHNRGESALEECVDPRPSVADFWL